MSSLLTDGLNCGLHYTDCKQNSVIRFQIINLLFSGRNSATFDAKVAEFLCLNQWFVCRQQDIYTQLQRWQATERL